MKILNTINMDHKQWLDNEYQLWIEALQFSTVDNFKEHPQVKRMLGEINEVSFIQVCDVLTSDEIKLIAAIDNIGNQREKIISGICMRMVYYALQVLEKNPKTIAEIGGGVGQFYAVLRALGYKGNYYIWDLTEVKKFQYKYLTKVAEVAGLNTELSLPENDFCCSFYALGEFDNETKAWYINNVVNKCEHGLIIWNGHSGASNDISKINHNLYVTQENPLTSKDNMQITW